MTLSELERQWRHPPPNLLLSNDDVHVWQATLERPPEYVAQLARTLSPDERTRAERFHFERDRRRYIVGRGTLRAILGLYLDVDPRQLQFRYGSHGKPHLSEESGGGAMQFNLAHSHEMALFAFARGRGLGIDLEWIKPLSDLEQIAASFFSRRENMVLQTLPRKQRSEAFFNCWTRKEAYLKATGDGLARPLEHFDVSLAPGKAARLLHVEGDPQESARWFLRALMPAPGYAAALAVEEGQHCRLVRWRWHAPPHSPGDASETRITT